MTMVSLTVPSSIEKCVPTSKAISVVTYMTLDFTNNGGMTKRPCPKKYGFSDAMNQATDSIAVTQISPLDTLT